MSRDYLIDWFPHCPLFTTHLGGCQNHGPFFGTLDMRCRIRRGIQKGTMILTTTYLGPAPENCLGILRPNQSELRRKRGEVGIKGVVGEPTNLGLPFESRRLFNKASTTQAQEFTVLSGVEDSRFKRPGFNV